MKRALRMHCATVMATMLGLWAWPALAQGNAPPHGENFSAKPAPQLFASDCTGAGCHKGPQGLGKNQSVSGLASFLREHYTNSRESASALAAYIMRVPGSAPAAEVRNPRQQPAARASRAAVQSEEETPAAAPRVRNAAEPNEAKPATPAAAARQLRGRHTTAANPLPPTPEPPSPSPPAAAAAAPAPTPPPPPAPRQYDIFD